MPTRGALSLLLCALLVLLAGGCAKDESETLVRVFVDSDLEVGSELTKLEIRIFDPESKEERRRQDFELAKERSGTRFALPMSIKLVPDTKRSESTDFLLVVTGIGPLGSDGSEVEVVEQQALASFRPGSALQLDIFLARRCLRRLCRDDDDVRSSLTCDVDTGECADVPTRHDLAGTNGDVDPHHPDAASVGRDAGGGDGLDAAESALDAQDAEGLETGSVGDGPNGTATLGAVCGAESSRACGGHNSNDALLCAEGKWALRTVCDGNTRCDTREGDTRGTCQAIAQACTGRTPNESICEGPQIRTCGADLIDSIATACPANQRCVSAPSAHCECDTGYALGSDGCTNIDDCVGNGCQHGGRCKDGIAKYSCECGGTGYEGDSCQSDVNECAEATSCSPNYPCTQTQAPGYVCLGHMADWPMPDSSPAAKYAPRYDTTVAGVVKDLVTGLWWERSNFADVYTWTDAKTYCEQLVTDSRSDWRLPSKIELESILDFARVPALDAVFGSLGTDHVYWTSSSNIEYLDAVWVVTFADGRSARGSKVGGDQNRARCVRSEQVLAGTPGTRYQVNEVEGWVLDTRTKLIWQRTIDLQKRSLAVAQTHCQARGPGWRLPAAKELLTLADPTTSPSIDVRAFPDTPTDWFISATLVSGDATQKWSVLFNHPHTGKGPADGGALVRCVK